MRTVSVSTRILGLAKTGEAQMVEGELQAGFRMAEMSPFPLQKPACTLDGGPSTVLKKNQTKKQKNLLGCKQFIV